MSKNYRTKTELMEHIIELKSQGVQGIPLVIGEVYDLLIPLHGTNFLVTKISADNGIDKGSFKSSLEKLQEFGYIKFSTAKRGGTVVIIVDKNK